MATRSTTHPTLLDVAKRVDPNGRIEGIAELLTENNPILMDLVLSEGNLKTGHRCTVRTGWPTPAWVKVGYGVQPQKSTTRQVTFNSGMMKEFSEVPADLIELGDNVAQFRASEETPFIDSMNSEMADTIFYGDEGSNESEFTGISAYYNNSSAQNGSQIIKGASTSGTDLRSIWIIGWGMNSVFCTYPKGYKSGLEYDDLGRYLSQTAPVEGSTRNDGRMFVYGAHYKWSMGLILKDWRFAVRIPNIQKNNLKKDASSGDDLIDLIHQGLNQMRNLTSVRPSVYMDRDLVGFVDRQSKYAVKDSTLKMSDIYGNGIEMMSVRGVPIHWCDALDTDEGVVS